MTRWERGFPVVHGQPQVLLIVKRDRAELSTRQEKGDWGGRIKTEESGSESKVRFRWSD